jgi:hypothetical protein
VLAAVFGSGGLSTTLLVHGGASSDDAARGKCQEFQYPVVVTLACALRPPDGGFAYISKTATVSARAAAVGGSTMQDHIAAGRLFSL